VVCLADIDLHANGARLEDQVSFGEGRSASGPVARPVSWCTARSSRSSAAVTAAALAVVVAVAVAIAAHPGKWQTASTLLPSGSSTKAP